MSVNTCILSHHEWNHHILISDLLPSLSEVFFSIGEVFPSSTLVLRYLVGPSERKTVITRGLLPKDKLHLGHENCFRDLYWEFN